MPLSDDEDDSGGGGALTREEKRQLRIQRELGALLDVTGDADWARALRAAAREALERAEHALSHDADIDDVRTLHAAALQDSQPTGGLTSPE